MLRFKPTTLEHQLKGATRGLHNGDVVDWAVTQTVKFLDSMDGNGAKHLAWLLWPHGLRCASH